MKPSSVTNIGKVAKRIEHDLNVDEPNHRYTVSTISGSPGIIRITDHITGKFRSIRLKYETKSRKRTIPLKWQDNYYTDTYGNAFDDSGKYIGKLQIIPDEPNKEGKCRSYLYDGIINTSPDSWQNITSDNITSVKSLLS